MIVKRQVSLNLTILIIFVFCCTFFLSGATVYAKGAKTAEKASESDVMLKILHAESGAVKLVTLNGKVVFDVSKHRRLTLFDKHPGLNHKSVFLYGQKVYSQTWDETGKPVGAPFIRLAPNSPSSDSAVQPPTTVSSPKATSKDKKEVYNTSKDNEISSKVARARALSYDGIPYKDGGYSRDGFKTAGLIWHYFKSFGLNVPRLLKEQSLYGEFVLKKDLRPGDIVTFKDGNRVNIIGIYIGNKEMLYMSYSKKKARRINIDSSWFAKRYGGARRYFGVKLNKIETSPEYSPVYPEDVVKKNPGKKYIPLPSGKEIEQGMCSFYGGGDGFNGSPTANGEVFDDRKLTAAHKTLPFNTMVKVVRSDTGQSVVVRINDRGPFVRGRIIDLSYAAAKKLGMVSAGVTKVRLYMK